MSDVGSKVKVICVGLGRTGTVSLAEALNKLGVGPCYHGINSLRRPDDDFKLWFDVGQGSPTAQEDMQNLLSEYNSFAGYPVSVNFEKLYKAYPDAKFILSTRDPAKWEASIKDTVLQICLLPMDHVPDSRIPWLYKWLNIDAMARYHRGRLLTDAQSEIIAHNQRVIATIPADRLLVYEISQGWDPLVKFLEVDMPDIPFPHVNDKVRFQELVTEIRKQLDL